MTRRVRRAIDLIDDQSDPGEDYALQVGRTVVNRFDLRDGRKIDPVEG